MVKYRRAERVSELYSIAESGCENEWTANWLSEQRQESRVQNEKANCISIVSEESEEAKEHTSKGRKLWVTLALSLEW